MKLPIRNFLSGKLLLVIEPLCEEYEVPGGGSALITLEDGPNYDICVYDQQITIWNNGLQDAVVEISTELFPKH